MAKRGRPSKYSEDLVGVLVKYFDVDLYRTEEVNFFRRGKCITLKKRVPSDYPTIEGFCLSISIGKKTFYRWVKKHPEFRHAYRAAKGRQLRLLVHHGLLSNYNVSFSLFLMRNCFSKQELKLL